MHPDFALSATLRLPRYGEGKARPKGSARRPRRRLSKGVERACSLRAILKATRDGLWRSSLGDRRTTVWPLSEAQNWRQALPTREGLAPVTFAAAGILMLWISTTGFSFQPTRDLRLIRKPPRGPLMQYGPSQARLNARRVYWFSD